MAEEERGGRGGPGGDVAEESHEALWTSMSTVIVCDKTWARSRPCAVADSSDSGGETSPAGRARRTGRGSTRPAQERRRTEQASDSDGSTSESDSGEPCRVVDVERESSSAKDGVTLADLLGGGTCPEAEDPPARPSAAAEASPRREALQGGDEDQTFLPSVERAQKQLDEIISRRHVISAISSKYSPAMPVGCFREKDSAPPAPARYPPPPPPLPEGVEAKHSRDDDDDPPLGHEVCLEAMPRIPECREATDDAKKAGQGPLTAVGEARPVRMSGPSARPDKTQISDVLRQLRAGLSGLGARPKAMQGLGGAEASEAVAPSSLRSKSESSEPAPPRPEGTASLTGEGPAKSSRSVEYPADDFTGIVDVDKPGLSGVRAAWAEETATCTSTGCSSAPVSSVASRYLASGDEGASEEPSGDKVQSRSATPPEGYAQAWSVDKEKFEAGKRQEESRREELWHQFLAGNDNPVGGDFLPSPDSYHGCGPP